MSLTEKLQCLLILLNIAVYIWGFFKFLKKPADNLRDRVVATEVRVGKLEEEQEKNKEKFHNQSETNEVLLQSVFALIEFEMQFCLTEKMPVTKGLEDAKDALHKYMYKS